jgi:hypothetical protein
MVGRDSGRHHIWPAIFSKLLKKLTQDGHKMKSDLLLAALSARLLSFLWPASLHFSGVWSIYNKTLTSP